MTTTWPRCFLAIPLARYNLPGLVSSLASNAINKFERKISRKEVVRAGKSFALFILNEDMNDIIKIIKSLEDLELVKDEIKKDGGFLSALLAPLVISIVQSVISSVVKGKSGWVVRRAGRGYMNKNF